VSSPSGIGFFKEKHTRPVESPVGVQSDSENSTGQVFQRSTIFHTYRPSKAGPG